LLKSIDSWISHPAVVAVLSAGLALGATWWLDARATERAARAAATEVALEFASDAAEVRLAALELFEAVADPEQDPPTRRLTVARATDFLDERLRTFQAGATGAHWQLSRFFVDRGAEPGYHPAELMMSHVYGLTSEIARCAGTLDGRFRGLSGDRPDAQVACDQNAPPGGDIVGFAGLLVRTIECAEAVQRANLDAIRSPRQIEQLMDTARALCGPMDEVVSRSLRPGGEL